MAGLVVTSNDIVRFVVSVHPPFRFASSDLPFEYRFGVGFFRMGCPSQQFLIGDRLDGSPNMFKKCSETNVSDPIRILFKDKLLVLPNKRYPLIRKIVDFFSNFFK